MTNKNLVIYASLLLMMPAVYAAPLERAAKGGDVSAVGGAVRIKGDQTPLIRGNLIQKHPKNVILLIGDGMGYSEMTAARNYHEGAGGYFKGLDALPITGSYTHYSIHKDSKKPNYVTDSAASATAWSSGVKTYNSAIGVDVNGKPQPTLLEQAKAAGLATGNISTAELQDATPAAQIAHVTHRKCHAPNITSKECPTSALENGGLGSITEQLLDNRPDISLGGGAKSFNETAKAGRWAGKTLLEQARERGFVIVTNAQELAAVKSANQKAPVLGLFASGNMPVRWFGPRAKIKGYAEEEPVIECRDNPDRNASVPTLAEMTKKAIDVLKTRKKGFFLQVEGAAIDKQDHAANPCGQIGETVDLDEAVQAALKFAEKDKNTLVIVTADHAHTSQILPNNTRSPGLTQKLRTKDGSVMYIGYATADPQDDHASMTHTGVQVRIAAYGPQAANVSGLLDQTDLHFIIKRALGLK
ncbi:MAG: alkaline phosphatase [Neisseria sp.]|uniref:alkaline phosphatase n=1 Tax=Neisseria sp. TaxID=192066 RepID=UPI0026DB68B2|nr:alkaline phosphatase [Neisseria sp.]MDO4640598.1 alkaline phosphatase [Neisseria sp.]